MPFVPTDFLVPATLETDQFRLRMLTVNDVVKDYDAVMSSLEHLQRRRVFNDSWPKSTLTLEQDLIDLGWHQKEFQTRRSFAYTVMSLDEAVCLGCVYIVPSPLPQIDARVYLWVRSSAVELDSVLEDVVRTWIEADWPFTTPVFPGRGHEH